MPVREYYKGRGEEVMRRMQDEYGEEGGKRVFYATHNKQLKAKRKSKKRGKRSRRPRA